MFDVRQEFASAEEVARQDLMWSVIRGESVLDGEPTTGAEGSTIMKKTAAIYGHRQINPVHQVKIYKSLDSVLQLLADEDATDVDDIFNKHTIRHVVKNKIKSVLDNTSVDVNDVLQLPVRPPVLAYSPEPPFTYDFKLPLRATTGVSLFAFELMAFNNRVIYQYYEGVTFSSYFYHNTMYMLGVSDADRLETDDRWQARLALIVKRTDFTDTVTMAAFYEDTVRYRGVGYDTSFVPDYDVYSMTQASRIGCDMAKSKPPPPPPQCTDSECINYKKRSDDTTIDDSVALLIYRAVLDVRRTDKVPHEYMSIFLTFPFKDGHYIRPDGTVIYLDVGLPRRSSVTLTIHRICDMSTLEQDVADAARTLRLQDVLAYALHAERLESQGVALLIMRQMIGNVIDVNGIKIRLPYANEVLDWFARPCVDKSNDCARVIMPKGGKDENSVAIAVALVQDIAGSVRSKLAAAFVCSSFHLKESDYRDVYDRLATDAELYVFFTLVIQQYNLNAYRHHRDRLKPKFDTKDSFQYSDPMAFLANKYRMYARPYADSSVQSRLDAFTVPLVTPTDVSAAIVKPICNPDRCMELYEFSDPQLKTLAATGNVDLTHFQIASYITLCISHRA